jgi:hypothetical protein
LPPPWVCRFGIGAFFTVFPIIEVQSRFYCREDNRRRNNRECDRRGNLSAGQATESQIKIVVAS